MNQENISKRIIETFSNEQLLFELIRRNGFSRISHKAEYCSGDFITSGVAIGEDTKVSITIESDDFNKMVAAALAR